MNNEKRTGYFDKVVIKELLSAEGLIVGDIDLDDDEYMANVLIEVNPVGLYSSLEISGIVSKIERIETTLVMQGFIHDIKFGDLYKGNWRILIHFLDEDEIEEWEKNANKEDINSEFIKGLAELFIKEPSSLEVLLMLSDEGPKTIKQISGDVIYDTKITGLLDKLRQSNVIDIKEDLVDITSYGKCIVKKLRGNKKRCKEIRHKEIRNDI